MTHMCVIGPNERVLSGMQEVLIVGCGITGSLTASLLARARPSLSLTVWDKARGAGGRMSTHRDPAHPSLHVDMGAQYVSRFSPRSTDTAAYRALKDETYTELMRSRVFQPLDYRIEGERIDHEESKEAKFAAPKGMSSVVEHFLGKSGATVAYQHQLQTVHIRDGRVLCETAGGVSDSFDAVVLTMPVPQILSLTGSLQDQLDPETQTRLEAVKYSSRYAVGLVFDGLSPSLRSVEWVMKYVDHPIIRFLSWNFSKGGEGGGTDGETLLVHTSVPFAVEHLETDKPRVEELIRAALTEVLPNLPGPSHRYLIRWRYSQVVAPYEGSPGFAQLCSEPLVLAAGDSFAGSNFENCLYSAQNTADHILKQLGS